MTPLLHAFDPSTDDTARLRLAAQHHRASQESYDQAVPGTVSDPHSGERLKGCRRAREIAGVFGTEFREVRETALGAVTLLLTALIVRMKQSGHILVVDRERRALVVDNCGGAYFALVVRCP